MFSLNNGCEMINSKFLLINLVGFEWYGNIENFFSVDEIFFMVKLEYEIVEIWY